MALNHGALFLSFFFTIGILTGFGWADNTDLQSLKRKPVPINDKDVVKAGETISIDKHQGALRIAVAAMISPKDTYKYYIDLLNLIGEQMDRKVIFIQKKTYSEINDLLENDHLDLAFICSGPYIVAKRKYRLEILVVPVCHGETVYYSFFIASHQSGIHSFSDLRGKTFAFTDPLSNTGYLAPTYALSLRGESIESFFKKTFFTHSHDNSIQAVADGLADGAAVDSLIFDFMTTRNPEWLNRIVVFEKSEPYGIPPVVIPPDLDPEIKDKLKNLFLSIHDHPKGRVALDNLQIERFVEGDDKAYDSVRKMEAYLSSQSR